MSPRILVTYFYTAFKAGWINLEGGLLIALSRVLLYVTADKYDTMMTRDMTS